MTQEEYENMILRIMTESDGGPSAPPEPATPEPPATLSYGDDFSPFDPMSFTDTEDESEMEKSKEELLRKVKSIDAPKSEDVLYYDINTSDDKKNVVNSLWEFLKKFWIWKKDDATVDVDKEAITTNSQAKNIRFYITARKKALGSLPDYRSSANIPDEMKKDIDDVVSIITRDRRNFVFSISEAKAKLAEVVGKWRKALGKNKELDEIFADLDSTISVLRAFEKMSPDYSEDSTEVISPEVSYYKPNLFWQMKSGNKKWPTREELNDGHIFDDMVKEGTLKNKRLADLSDVKKMVFGKRWLDVFNAILKTPMNDSLRKKAYTLYIMLCRNADTSDYPALDKFLSDAGEGKKGWNDVSTAPKRNFVNLPNEDFAGTLWTYATTKYSAVKTEIRRLLSGISDKKMIESFIDRLKTESGYMADTINAILNNGDDDYSASSYDGYELTKTILSELDDKKKAALLGLLYKCGPIFDEEENASYIYNLAQASRLVKEIFKLFQKDMMASGFDPNALGIRKHIDVMDHLIQNMIDAEKKTDTKETRNHMISDKFQSAVEEGKISSKQTLDEFNQTWKDFEKEADTELKEKLGSMRKERENIEAKINELKGIYSEISRHIVNKLSKNAVNRHKSLYPASDTAITYSIKNGKVNDKGTFGGSMPDYASVIPSNISRSTLVSLYMNLWDIFDYAAFKTADMASRKDIRSAITRLSRWIRRCISDNMSGGPGQRIKETPENVKEKLENRISEQNERVSGALGGAFKLIDGALSDERFEKTKAAAEGKTNLLTVDTKKIMHYVVDVMQTIKTWLDTKKTTDKDKETDQSLKISLEKMSDENATALVEAVYLILRCWYSDENIAKEFLKEYTYTSIEKDADSGKELKRGVRKNKPIDLYSDVIYRTFDSETSSKTIRAMFSGASNGIDELKNNVGDIIDMIRNGRRVYANQSTIMLGTLKAQRDLLAPIFDKNDFNGILALVNGKKKKALSVEEKNLILSKLNPIINKLMGDLVFGISTKEHADARAEYEKKAAALDALKKGGETDEAKLSAAKIEYDTAKTSFFDIESNIVYRTSEAIRRIVNYLTDARKAINDFDVDEFKRDLEKEKVVPQKDEKIWTAAPKRERSRKSYSMNYGLIASSPEGLERTGAEEDETDDFDSYVISKKSALEFCDRLNSGEYDNIVKNEKGELVGIYEFVDNISKREEDEEETSAEDTLPPPVDPTITNNDKNSIFYHEKIKSIEDLINNGEKATRAVMFTKVRNNAPIGAFVKQDQPLGTYEPIDTTTSREASTFFHPFYAMAFARLQELESTIRNDRSELRSLLDGGYNDKEKYSDDYPVKYEKIPLVTEENIKKRIMECDPYEIRDTLEAVCERHPEFKSVIDEFNAKYKKIEDDAKANAEANPNVNWLNYNKTLNTSSHQMQKYYLEEIGKTNISKLIADDINTYLKAVNDASDLVWTAGRAVANLGSEIDSIYNSGKTKDGQEATASDKDRIRNGIIRKEEETKNPETEEESATYSANSANMVDKFNAYAHRLVENLYKPKAEVEDMLNRNPKFGMFVDKTNEDDRKDSLFSRSDIDILVTDFLNWFNFNIEMIRFGSNSLNMTGGTIDEINTKLDENKTKLIQKKQEVRKHESIKSKLNSELRDTQLNKKALELPKEIVEKIDRLIDLLGWKSYVLKTGDLPEDENAPKTPSEIDDEINKIKKEISKPGELENLINMVQRLREMAGFGPVPSPEILGTKESQLKQKINDVESIIDGLKAEQGVAQDAVDDLIRQKRSVEMFSKKTTEMLEITKDNWEQIVAHMETWAKRRLVNKIDHDFDRAWVEWEMRSA